MSRYSINRESSQSMDNNWLDPHAPNCPASCFIPRRHRRFYRGQLCQLDTYDDCMFELMMINSSPSLNGEGQLQGQSSRTETGVFRPPHNAIKQFNSRIPELSYPEDSTFHSCPCHMRDTNNSSRRDSSDQFNDSVNYTCNDNDNENDHENSSDSDSGSQRNSE